MKIIVIADQAKAVGYYLAGAEVLSPELDLLPEVLETAVAKADMLLLSAEYASYLSDQLLKKYIVMEKPLFWVIPEEENIDQVEAMIKEIQIGLGISIGE